MISFSYSDRPPKRTDDVHPASPNLSQISGATPASSSIERNLPSSLALPVAAVGAADKATNAVEVIGKFNELLDCEAMMYLSTI